MRRTALRVLAVLLLALAGACSDDDGGGNGDEAASDEAPTDGGGEDGEDDVVGEAVAATLAEGSARIAVATEIEGLAGSDEPLVAEGEGVVDFETRASTVTIDLASVLEGLGLPGLDGEVESRSVGDERWLRSPFFNTVLGVTTEWLLLDVGAADGEADSLTQIGALTGNDPADQLRLLRGVDPATIEEIGEEDVSGDSTTHFRGVLDPSTALDRVPEEDRARLEGLVAQFGTAPVDVDIWIDDDGHVRQLATAVPLPPAAGGGAAHVRMTLFDFGVDVDVEPPPADDVTPASEITNPGP